MRILGIETSADDTGVALVEAEGSFGPYFRFNVLGNAVNSQPIHSEYGGIYPNIAKREHAKSLVPMLEEALWQSEQLTANGEQSPRTVLEGSQRTILGEMLKREPELFQRLELFLASHEKPDIDCIAVTVGPGLEPCLWAGVNFARTLSIVWSIPIVAVNHMEGHVVMSMMKKNRLAEFDFPTLALLISGGHTELVLMRALGQYELVGKTRDDAVGEAFDKVARMLDIPYPGGPEISRLADEARCNEATPHRIRLPRPMMNEDNFDFSFAGLKTAVLRIVEAQSPLSEDLKKQIAREFEDAAADVLVTKTLRAIEEYGVQTLIVGGGVSANKHIRAKFDRKLKAASCKLLVCPPELSTDNALMIALSGYFHALKKEYTEAEQLTASGQLKLA